MGFWRNPEIRRDALIGILLGIALCAAGFFLSQTAGIVATTAWALFMLLHFWAEWTRYRRIARLCGDLDKLLHNGGSIDLSSYQEGELSALADGIAKLTSRLLGQAESAGAEKDALADSLADISHQLRTPLTSINLLISLLKSEGLDETRRREQLTKLERQTDRMEWLVEALLKLARLDAGRVAFKKERVRLGVLAKKAAAAVAVPMDMKGQTLLLNGDHEASFTGDAAWTAEALVNILKNCMEHTPEGGSISVFWQENAIFSEIVVKDSGPGIPKEELPRLFERFYRGSGAAEGSAGIGLSLSRSIVCAQNGTIKVENARDGGAQFTIRFYKTSI
ncbi:MAG: sensor histidine kinase [Christensenellales bacterium]|jgi:signal transduction histidine kinase